MSVSLAALETHFFQILRRPKPERKAKPNLRERDAKVINNFLLLPPPPCNLGFVFDNRWVVPYNPYLTMQYQCHINVEVCSSITAVKYLYKYVYKGHAVLWQWCSRKLGLCRLQRLRRLQVGPMGTMCLPLGMKSKITSMGGMSMPAKLAIGFLPLNCTACTPMFTAWLFIYLMSKPLTFLRAPRLGKP